MSAKQKNGTMPASDGMCSVCVCVWSHENVTKPHLHKSFFSKTLNTRCGAVNAMFIYCFAQHKTKSLPFLLSSLTNLCLTHFLRFNGVARNTLDIGQGYFYFDSFAVFVCTQCTSDGFRVSHTLCGCAYNWTWTRHMWVRQPANVMWYKIRCPSQTNCLLHKFSAKFIQNVWTWHSPAVTVNVSFITSCVPYFARR